MRLFAETLEEASHLPLRAGGVNGAAQAAHKPANRDSRKGWLGVSIPRKTSEPRRFTILCWFCKLIEK